MRRSGTGRVMVRATRWSLLTVALVLGVALMHTLGHSVHTRSAAMPSMAPGAMASELFASDLADTWLGPADQVAHHQSPSRHGMDPSVMCLAVLTMFLLFAAAAYRILRSGSAVASHAWPRFVGGSRAPPGTPVGRAVAALSVMRI